MNSSVIEVQGLGKRYRIGANRVQRNLRETITDLVKAPFERVSGASSNRNRDADRIWALKDVSFSVEKGEVLGIIGRNGAGKSTLLKILSRITKPTEGYARIRGRVGSLLEVGTGFHPELTGRENVYLSGAILGMTRAEIARKFDEIVAFSEVEKFLDTPVKHYSSGMYLRLAFAVAAHLEPEILIVDEVLAVGDAEFQRKCLGKMKNVASEGRTVVFVSHDMAAIQRLCDQVILLRSGQIAEEGDPQKLITKYLQSELSLKTERTWHSKAAAPGNELFRLYRACVRPLDGTALNPIMLHKPFVFEFDYWSYHRDGSLDLSVQLYNEEGVLVFDIGREERPVLKAQADSRYLLRDTCLVPGDLLNDGAYWIDLAVSRHKQRVYHHPYLLTFDIEDVGYRRGGWYGNWAGVIRPRLQWHTDVIHENVGKGNADLTEEA